MQKLQELIDQTPDSGTLMLTPPKGEFPGPARIKRPITIIGNGASVMSREGPVVSIEAGGVVICDLNVEVTGKIDRLSAQRACALVVKQGAEPNLKDVSVRGSIVGLTNEKGDWQYPKLLNLKKLQCGRPHNLRLHICTPVPCELSSDIDGVKVTPRSINGGSTEVTVHVEPLAPGVRLRGSLILRSAFLTVHLKLTGSSTKSPDDKGDVPPDPFWTPKDWETRSSSSPALIQEPKSRKKRRKKSGTKGSAQPTAVPVRIENTGKKQRKATTPIPDAFTDDALPDSSDSPPPKPTESPDTPAAVTSDGSDGPIVVEPPDVRTFSARVTGTMTGSAFTGQPKADSENDKPEPAVESQQTAPTESERETTTTEDRDPMIETIETKPISGDSKRIVPGRPDSDAFIANEAVTPADSDSTAADSDAAPAKQERPPKKTPKKRKIVKPTNDFGAFGGSNDTE